MSILSIKAPFTEEQVKNLNDFQKSGRYHPFTCCSPDLTSCKRKASNEKRMNGEEVPYTDENEGILVATTEGWVCPCGEYKQNWAHSFMAEPLPPDPFEKFRNK